MVFCVRLRPKKRTKTYNKKLIGFHYHSPSINYASMFGSYLVDFDKIFAPKWSCKDLLFEIINC